MVTKWIAEHDAVASQLLNLMVMCLFCSVFFCEFDFCWPFLMVGCIVFVFVLRFRSVLRFCLRSLYLHILSLSSDTDIWCHPRVFFEWNKLLAIFIIPRLLWNFVRTCAADFAAYTYYWVVRALSSDTSSYSSPSLSISSNLVLLRYVVVAIVVDVVAAVVVLFIEYGPIIYMPRLHLLISVRCHWRCLRHW